MDLPRPFSPFCHLLHSFASLNLPLSLPVHLNSVYMRLLSSATLKIAGGSNLQPVFAHLAEARTLEDLVRLIVSSLVAKMYTEAPGPAGVALRYVSSKKTEIPRVLCAKSC